MELPRGNPSELVLSPDELAMLLVGGGLPPTGKEWSPTPLVAHNLGKFGDRLAAKQMRIQGRGRIGSGEAGPALDVGPQWRKVVAQTLAAWAIRFEDHATGEARISGDWEIADKTHLLVDEFKPVMFLTGGERVGLIDVESPSDDTPSVKPEPQVEPSADVRAALDANNALMAEIWARGAATPPIGS